MLTAPLTADVTITARVSTAPVSVTSVSTGRQAATVRCVSRAALVTPQPVRVSGFCGSFKEENFLRVP